MRSSISRILRSVHVCRPSRACNFATSPYQLTDLLVDGPRLHPSMQQATQTLPTCSLHGVAEALVSTCASTTLCGTRVLDGMNYHTADRRRLLRLGSWLTWQGTSAPNHFSTCPPQSQGFLTNTTYNTPMVILSTGYCLCFKANLY
jgi:hypothetical protein